MGLQQADGRDRVSPSWRTVPARHARAPKSRPRAWIERYRCFRVRRLDSQRDDADVVEPAEVDGQLVIDRRGPWGTFGSLRSVKRITAMERRSASSAVDGGRRAARVQRQREQAPAAATEAIAAAGQSRAVPGRGASGPQRRKRHGGSASPRAGLDRSTPFDDGSVDRHDRAEVAARDRLDEAAAVIAKRAPQGIPPGSGCFLERPGPEPRPHNALVEQLPRTLHESSSDKAGRQHEQSAVRGGCAAAGV